MVLIYREIEINLEFFKGGNEDFISISRLTANSVCVCKVLF